MTRKQQKEVLVGIVNQLDSHEKRELLLHLIDNVLIGKQRKEILEYCLENHKADYICSMEENGLLENE